MAVGSDPERQEARFEAQGHDISNEHLSLSVGTLFSFVLTSAEITEFQPHDLSPPPGPHGTRCCSGHGAASFFYQACECRITGAGVFLSASSSLCFSIECPSLARPRGFARPHVLVPASPLIRSFPFTSHDPFPPLRLLPTNISPSGGGAKPAKEITRVQQSSC